MAKMYHCERCGIPIENPVITKGNEHFCSEDCASLPDQARQIYLDALGGRDEKAVKAAWAKVKDPDDWRGCIKKVVTVQNAEEVELIKFATEFYTGAPTTIEDLGDGKINVRCVGYRCGPLGHQNALG